MNRERERASSVATHHTYSIHIVHIVETRGAYNVHFNFLVHQKCFNQLLSKIRFNQTASTTTWANEFNKLIRYYFFADFLLRSRHSWCLNELFRIWLGEQEHTER